jgi:hypothetical protein
MSEQSNEDSSIGGISDEDLPEDVRPSDDNPLAKNPDDLEDAELGGDSAKPHGAPDLGEASS